MRRLYLLALVLTLSLAIPAIAAEDDAAPRTAGGGTAGNK